MQSNVPPCKVYYIYYIDVTNLKISQLSYMALTINTAFKPGKCQMPAGLVLIHISTAFQWIFTFLL